MPGHYCTIAEAECGRQTNATWRLALIAVAACTATAAFLFAVSPAASQNYASSTQVRSMPAISSVVPTGRLQGMNSQRVAAGVQRYESSPELHSLPAQHSFTGTLAVTGGFLMLAGAAVTYAKQLFAAKSEAQPVAMLATTGESSEKEAMRQLVAQLDSADMRTIARGGSMAEVARSKGIDEVAQAIRADQLSRKDLTPKDVILEMQRGNGRFWMGLSERPDMDAISRRALIMAQAPKICVLSCSDSRVPVEIIFDQGLGEIFVVRMAGNILDANAHGSIEFAVKYLGVKVILVIGHEGCGAVKGAMGMSPEDIGKEPFDLQVVLQSIRGGLDVKELNNISDMRAREREAIVLNTSNQVKKLQQNQLIADKCAEGSLLVAGAFYEISSGIVDFFSLDKNGLVIDI